MIPPVDTDSLTGRSRTGLLLWFMSAISKSQPGNQVGRQSGLSAALITIEKKQNRAGFVFKGHS